MAERQLPKLHTGVRFPSPALLPMKTGLELPLLPESQTLSSFVVRFPACRQLAM